MAKYDITKEAAEDLYRIWAYTVDTWSEEQADTYGLRAYHVRRHMLFFTVQPNGRALIARILHERMDYARHFTVLD